MLFDMRNSVVQSLQAVRKAIGKLYACVLVIFEEMRESKLISVLIFLILYWICIWDPASSSSPSWQFLHIPITHLHAFIIQTRALGKALDYKMSLPSDPLHREVKPRWNTIGVRLFLQFYLKGVGGYQSSVPKTTALEIALEQCLTHRHHPASLGLHTSDVPSCLFDIQFFVRIGLLEDQLQSMLF